MTIASKIPSLSSIDSKEFHLLLIKNRGRIVLDSIDLICCKTFLNVVYMHHAYLFFCPDLNDFILYINVNQPVCVYSRTSGLEWFRRNAYLAEREELITGRLNKILNTIDINPHSLIDTNKIGQRDMHISFISGTQQHMSHYLWNHLASLWSLRHLLNSRVGTKFVIIKGSELYGPLTQIFNLQNFEVVYLDSYDRSSFTEIDGICIEPYYLSAISSALCTKIININTHSFHEKDSHTTVNDTLTITIALRTDNRTCNNILDIFDAIHEVLECKHPGVSIDLNFYLRTSFTNDSLTSLESDKIFKKIQIIRSEVKKSSLNSKIGEMAFLYEDSLGFTFNKLSKSNFCISEWGASMAITRWILHLPTIVLVNNQLHQSLIDIETASLSKHQRWGNYISESDGSLLYICNSAKDFIDSNKTTSRVMTDNYCVDLNTLKKMLTSVIDFSF